MKIFVEIARDENIVRGNVGPLHFALEITVKQLLRVVVHGEKKYRLLGYLSGLFSITEIIYIISDRLLGFYLYLLDNNRVLVYRVC